MIACRRLLQSLLMALALLLPATAGAAALPRVAIDTGAGTIVIEVDTKRAPVTAGNFLRYVDAGRFNGTTFYRAARSKRNPAQGLVQGGINHKVVRAFAPIAHEPTSKTGLRHVEGTVSMARNAPGTAMGDFFVVLGSAGYLDAAPGNPGYAAFGRVVGGMPVLRKILAAETFPGGWSKTTIGQSIRNPIRIIRARRLGRG